MMRRSKGRLISGLTGILGIAGAASALAGQQTWDFTTDPATGAAPLTIGGNGINPGEWQQSGGNPGGFLALTWPVGSQVSIVRFPNIDPGKVVTAFKFEADLRVGNSTGDRAADGFSVSFARDGDPALTDEVVSAGNQGVFAGGIAEGGTTTGIAVSFDTWSGNTLPDGGDIEGIIVRVDNKTVLRQSLPTRHGACADATSLQTGPWDQAYWTNGGDYQDPASWAGLCWQPLVVDITEAAKLTVSWKGRKILDGFQTTYFPTAGQLVLAGRTGGANEHTHLDNIKLTTVAASCAGAPTVPTNVRVVEAGALRGLIAWDASSIGGDPNARVGYEIERDGTVVQGSQTATSYESTGLSPQKTYAFRVRSKNVCGDASNWASVSLTTVAETDMVGFLNAQVYRTSSDGTAFGGADQGSMDTVLGDAKYPNSPDSTYYVNGVQFGEPNFGDTYGDNHMVRIAGILTAPKTAQYRFYVRADDAARFFIKAGTTIPNALSDTPVAQENGCCGGFEEPGAGDNGDGTFPTSEPISLTAGQKYAFLFLVKEGGGGDWGQVGWRENGNTDPVQPITGPVLSGGKGDSVGAVVNFTQNPASATVTANQSLTLTAAVEASSPYGKPPYYQWYKDNAIIAGATSLSYTIPIVAAGDAGKYALEVGVVGLVKKSAEATITVTPDTKAPAIVKAEGFGGTVTVTFDEPVKATTGTFTVSGGVTVSGAVQAGTHAISLKTSDLTSQTAYTVTATGVQDNAGNTVAAGSTASFTSWRFVPGVVKVQYYDGLSPSTLGNLQNVRRTTAPTIEYTTNLFGAFTDRAENFGTVLSAVIRPQTTGDYVFFISADDNAQLWLSTDESPANVKRVAIEPTWNGARDWVGTARRNADNPENRSDKYTGTQWPTGNKITLNANSRYYVEMIAQEGGGGDNSAVAWKLASAADPASGDSPITGAAIFGSYFPPAAVAAPTISIARDGANTRITYTGTLQGATVVTGPWTDVAGASSPFSAPANGASRYWRSRN